MAGKPPSTMLGGGRSLLWVALGVVALGLVSPDNLVSLRRLQRTLGGSSSEAGVEGEDSWQVSVCYCLYCCLCAFVLSASMCRTCLLR